MNVFPYQTRSIVRFPQPKTAEDTESWSFEFPIDFGPNIGLRLIIGIGISIVFFMGIVRTLFSPPGEVLTIQENILTIGNPDQSVAINNDKIPKNQAVENGINRDCVVSDKFPGKVRQWCPLIMKYSSENGLKPDLLAALIWQESGGNAQAYSRSGAVGLMQVMARDGLAANFTCTNGPCFKNRPTIKELKDPEFNIKYGAKMLKGLLRRTGDLREALKLYGPMDMGYYYADRILSIVKQYGNK